MRYKGRETSDNIDNRLPRKSDKKRGADDWYILEMDVPSASSYGQRHIVNRAEVERISAKLTPGIPPEKESKQRRYKNIDAAKKDDAEKAPVPLPRKRPSQVYIEAPKPKTKPHMLPQKRQIKELK